ncbi:hypothetical protein C5L28_002225 [Lentilactobacillus parakefiri]|uniref:Integral membrane protein n=1 Tax=Lentilactobacillus parakefiri TaxID=152332 RepID=A0A224VJX1_9LACO|nr:hypothetical protein C5L28_002225 [Lentilactobacillus parakefiri]GAW72821.1 integral membrane protein [Lentilactobacillus parakefiri]
MDCVVTPLKTLMDFSVHLNVQLKFYNLPFTNHFGLRKTLTEDLTSDKTNQRSFTGESTYTNFKISGC